MSTERIRDSREVRGKYSFSSTISVGKDGVPITLLTNSPKYRDIFTPDSLGWNIKQEPTSRQSVYSAVFEEATEPRITYRETDRIMTVSGQPEQLEKSLVYILYAFSEAPRQADNRFTLHAAAVSKGNRGVLILGCKGAGKTSLAMSLCLEWGYDLIGNDVVIVGKSADGNLLIYKGDGMFKPRRLTMGEFPDHKGAVVFNEKENDFEAKATIHPGSLGVTVRNRPVPLTDAVQIFIHGNKSASLQISCPPPEALRLNMYENATRYVRGVTTPVFDGGGRLLCCLPPFDNPDISGNRIRFLEEVIGGLGVTSVAGGNLREISEYVQNQKRD